jgi:hypothetical protein
MSEVEGPFYITYEDADGETFRTPDIATEAEADAKAEELCAAGFKYVLIQLAA